MVEVRGKLLDTDLARDLIDYCEKLKFDENGNRRKGLIPKGHHHQNIGEGGQYVVS